MSGSSLTLPSFAKINWDLRILRKRDDGFHEICTTLQTVSLSDEITFRRSAGLTLTCGDPDIPTDHSNLIISAAKLLKTKYSVDDGAAIHLEKRIPSPGGLGGGSSNAAVALIGLSRLWTLDMTLDDLSEMGRDLGSDVPFFFHGGTALGIGRGEQILDVRDRVEKFMLVVTPEVTVSTRDAYARIEASGLTKEDPKRILQICRSNAESPDLHAAALKNDLEPIVAASFPEIARVKEKLLGLGAGTVMLSGSGASIFAVFDKEETRQTALKALDHESTWRKFVVATISRSEYREALQLVY